MFPGGIYPDLGVRIATKDERAISALQRGISQPPAGWRKTIRKPDLCGFPANDHLDGGVTGRPVVPVTASYGHLLLLVQVEPVQALPGVREIIPLDDDVLFFETA